MTWPADGTPRYKAASISGGAPDTPNPPKAEGYVYDRARGHASVARTTANAEWQALRAAERVAAALNAGAPLEDERGRAVVHAVAHGTETAYRHGGCRCSVCTAASSARRLARLQRARRCR